MLLNSVTIDYLPSIDDIVDSPLDIFIYLVENDCVYVGSALDLMVEWVLPMF